MFPLTNHCRSPYRSLIEMALSWNQQNVKCFCATSVTTPLGARGFWTKDSCRFMADDISYSDNLLKLAVLKPISLLGPRHPHIQQSINSKNLSMPLRRDSRSLCISLLFDNWWLVDWAVHSKRWTSAYQLTMNCNLVAMYFVKTDTGRSPIVTLCMNTQSEVTRNGAGKHSWYL